MFKIQPQFQNSFRKQLNSLRNIKLKAILLICLCVYLLAVIYITLFAWNYGASLGPVGPGGRNYNMIPFRSIYRIAIFSPTIVDPIIILIGDIILFLPFGFLLPIAIRKLRTSVQATTILGMLFSLAIETSQFVFTFRVSNIDDVMLNTLGAFIGALLIKLCFFLKTKIIYFQT